MGGDTRQDLGVAASPPLCGPSGGAVASPSPAKPAAANAFTPGPCKCEISAAGTVWRAMIDAASQQVKP